MSLAARTYVVLLHHPVYNREGQVVTTAVTNLDIHDIARTAPSPPVVPAPVRRPSRAHLNLVPLEAKLRLVMVLLGEIPPLAFGSVGMTGQSRAKLSFRPRSRRSRATSGGISPR